MNAACLEYIVKRIREEQSLAMPRRKLNDGNEIPMLAYGLGTANFKGSKDSVERSIIEVTSKAIRAGFRHLDCAELYGNEVELGIAIEEAGIPREKLYIVTKLYDFSDPKASFEASLKRLRLNYVDLYLIHAPFHSKSDTELQNVWADLEDIKTSGLARSIGVSNFSKSQLETILRTATIPPAINQIEYHPYLQQDDLVQFHQLHNIATSVYGSLLPLHQKVDGPILDIWQKLAQTHGVSQTEVGLRWPIDQGFITVTTTSKENRMIALVSNIPRFRLSRDEVKEIAAGGNNQQIRGFWAAQFDMAMK